MLKHTPALRDPVSWMCKTLANRIPTLRKHPTVRTAALTAINAITTATQMANRFERYRPWRTQDWRVNRASEHPQEADRFAKNHLLSQEVESLSVLGVDCDKERWNVLLDQALELNSFSLVFQLFKIKPLNALPEGDIRITKFWELFEQEFQKPEMRPELLSYLCVNKKERRQGITQKVISQMIQFYKDENQIADLSVLLSDAISFNEPIAKEDLFTLIQVLQESKVRGDSLWPPFNGIQDIPISMIDSVWDELFDEAIRSEKMGDLLLNLCHIKPLNDRSDPRVARFWEWCVMKAEKSNQYFMQAICCAVILDENIASKIATAIFQDIQRVENISDQDVHFHDDISWDDGRVDQAARNRVKARQILPCLKCLVNLLSSLKEDIDLGRCEKNKVFTECLNSLKRLMRLPYVNQALRCHHELSRKIEKLNITNSSEVPQTENREMTEEKACEVLKLPLSEIKNKKKIYGAYRKAALENHPDLQGPEATSRMQQINTAKELLLAAVDK